ncbi:MAG TPA: lectin-like protein, partial [Polyangiales bacterium]|nr:lectin-like protein [Polyangiales bacterium]
MQRDGGPGAIEPVRDGGRPVNPIDAGSTVADCAANAGSTLCPTSCPERCNALDDDCDGRVDEDGDAMCAADHTVSVCSAGECLIVECLDDHRDCDDDAGSGCEASPTDPAHCGTCGFECVLEHATAACSAGSCVVAACEAGFGDCDGDATSCETSLDSLTHCGECGGTCGGLAHASPLCDGGSCGVKSCLGNFADCNGRGDDGCETSLDALDQCAACGGTCAKASCAGGVCTAVLCADPLADCDRDEVDCEVDLSNDVAHCGGCGLACAFSIASPHATLDCAARDCRALCEVGYGDCDEDYATGCESALADPANCGSCNANCNAILAHSAQTSCNAGACELITCAAGWADCDGVDANGCEQDTAASGPCLPDPDCVKRVSGTHEYYFCPTPRTWSAARDRCRAKTRGDLVAIGGSAENAFVQANRSADSWIAARDDLSEGLWRWSNDNVPFWRGTAAGSSVLSGFASWGAGQPDDFNAAEDCAEFLSGGTWNDLSCTATRAFVCEVPPDECPNDASKIAPGQCGCGSPDLDADSDGFAVCNDACEGNPGKQAAGMCGCAVAETDADGDTVPDCIDQCPRDPTLSSPCLVFAPTNFDPKPINWSAQPSSTLNCGTTTIDSTDPDGTGPLVATITGWCGTLPVPVAQAQNVSGGPELVIIPLRGLTVAATYTLRFIGPRPILLAVRGNATIDGTIDASASGTSAGAGGNWSCTSNDPDSLGGNGRGNNARLYGASGGGGGGFATRGGDGGTANTNGGSEPGGAGGAARGDGNLSPLFGGCAGGLAGDCGTAGAAGGGALQISVSGTLDVNGTIRANGGAGATPCGANDEGGGTGGGSGGALLLEAKTLDTAGATLQVNGGSGGRNGQYSALYSCG